MDSTARPVRTARSCISLISACRALQVTFTVRRPATTLTVPTAVLRDLWPASCMAVSSAARAVTLASLAAFSAAMAWAAAAARDSRVMGSVPVDPLTIQLGSEPVNRWIQRSAYVANCLKAHRGRWRGVRLWESDTEKGRTGGGPEHVKQVTQPALK